MDDLTLMAFVTEDVCNNSFGDVSALIGDIESQDVAYVADPKAAKARAASVVFCDCYLCSRCAQTWRYPFFVSA